MYTPVPPADTDSQRLGQTQTTSPAVSICLITYNRAAFLEPLLARVVNEGLAELSYEIVLCDNASTDDTPRVALDWTARCPQIRYFRQRENVGALNNLLTAYRRAAGKYCIYLADDDLLIVKGVVETIGFLESNPDVIACHAPWEFWNDVTQQAGGVSYRVKEPRAYDSRETADLFNFIIHNHVFPEICIYRTAFLQRFLLSPSKAYWAFVHLAQCLRFGKVAFRSVPFYRSVVEHSVRVSRTQMGHSQALTELDCYRAGLEVLADSILDSGGVAGVPAAQREAVQLMIHRFICLRLAAAFGLLGDAGDHAAALEALARLHVNGLFTDDQFAVERRRLAPHAFIHALVKLATGLSVREFVLCEIAAADQLLAALMARRPDFALRTLSLAAVIAEVPREGTLVLTSSAGHRERLVAAGFVPGFVVIDQDIALAIGLQ